MSALMLDSMQWFLLICASFCVIRLVLSRGGADKLTALNVLSGIVLAFLVLRGVREARALYLDVALVYDIFGFLGFLAVGHFLKDEVSREGGGG